MNGRGIAAYAVAACAHALLLAWAYTPMRVTAPPRSPHNEIAIETLAEVEVETAPAPAPVSEEAAAMREVAPPHATRVVATAGVAQPTSSAQPAASAEIAGGSNGTFIVFAPSTGITGAGQLNPFLAGRGTKGAGAPEEGPSPTAKRKDTTLADALRVQDVAKGLGPEGPVIRALEEATLAGAAPIKGSATFKAIVDATGIVVDLKLVAWRDERPGWDDTRERAALALAKKKLELRGAQGAELRIKVDSDLKLPSGASANGLSQKKTVLSLDPVDVGARPTRTVHAHLESFKLL